MGFEVETITFLFFSRVLLNVTLPTHGTCQIEESEKKNSIKMRTIAITIDL